jgi:hypothetical protein
MFADYMRGAYIRQGLGRSGARKGFNDVACGTASRAVAAVRVHPTSLRSTIGSRVYPKPGVTFDQTAAKRLAPRRFS